MTLERHIFDTKVDLYIIKATLEKQLREIKALEDEIANIEADNDAQMNEELVGLQSKSDSHSLHCKSLSK